MAQRSHRLFPDSSSKIYSDIIELRPQRRLRVCIVTRKEKKAEDFETHFRCADDTALGVTVFLIHGVGGSVEVWRSQFDSLIIQNTVNSIVAIDLVGHGQSSAPSNCEAYQFTEISLDVTALFTRFRSKNNIIIAHSYGYCFTSIS